MRTMLRYSWILAAALLASASVYAQESRTTTQRVESRKGYMARIPAEAQLDSSASGWNPKELFERRVYRIPGAGQIRFTVTVKPMTIPDSATRGNAYTYLDADSATPGGIAKIRTYYLPTRSVRIEIIPDGMIMRRYLDAREVIFNSFRWKPGATTDDINIGPPSRPN